MVCDRLLLCYRALCAMEKQPECCNDREKCVDSHDNRSKVRCEEKKKKYILDNTKKNMVTSFHMDGGMIVVDKTVSDSINKCDYLLLVQGNMKCAIAVELKGINISKALKQIDATIEQYKSFWKEVDCVYGRAVVTSSVPRLKATPEYVNLSKKIKRYKGNIKIVERQFLEKDVELAIEQR